MYDCHLHCYHSQDSDTPIIDMVNKAIECGYKYMAFSDHLDRDYLYDNSPDNDIPQIDLDKHIREIREYSERFKGIIDIAVGVECGYSKSSENDYVRLVNNSNFDVVLNSIHTVNGIDCYHSLYYDNKSKRQAYSEYLLAVLDSVNSKIDYNVITHIGYVCRKAPYQNKEMEYSEYKDILDTIFKSMIDRNVSLELNTHTKSDTLAFLPYEDIINRYLELGGVNFTFGSDAHRVNRVGEKFDKVRDFLLSKNIKYINTYKNKIMIKNKL